MDAAEHLSVSHSRLTRQDLYEMKQRNENIDYYNAKRLNQYHKAGPLAGELLENHKALIMSNSLHFGNVGINTSVSAVHVPTNVYDGGKFWFNYFILPPVKIWPVLKFSQRQLFISLYTGIRKISWENFVAAIRPCSA